MISRTLTLAVFTLSVLFNLISELELRRIAFKGAIADPGPPFSISKSVFPTLSADLLWITTVVRYGESKASLEPVPPWLVETGNQISELDPFFRANYEFLPAMALSGRHSKSTDEIESVNALLARAAEVYPHDGSFHFSAALNYIGHSQDTPTLQRISELKKAIELIRLSVLREPADDKLAVLRWFHRRLSVLENRVGSTLSDEDLARLVTLGTLDPEMRSAFDRSQLASHPFESGVGGFGYLNNFGLEATLGKSSL